MIDKEMAKQKGINIIDTQAQENPLLQMLKKHFPQTIKDNQINLKSLALALELNENLANMQGYELTFTGKGLANALYSTPAQKELKFESAQSHKSENSKNFIIRGDNLDVLKLLKAGYNEKIKMIYIDPPYNTKNDNFIYPDNFREDYTNILKEVGLLEFDEEKEEWRESETLSFFAHITATRSHSAWLAFMLPRLKLARDLLREDGVIFISIDDNEQANLKILCDEIFGEENYLETFLWNKTQTPPSASSKTRKTHEFILCYQKVKDNKKMIARFSNGGDAPLWNETNSERVLSFPQNYVYTSLKDGFYKKGLRDKIELLDDVEVKDKKIISTFRLKGHFRWKQETLDNEIDNGVYLIVKSDKFSIRYCRQDERIVMPTNEISKKDNVGTNETASTELHNLMGAKVFNFNKPFSLIKYLVSLVSNNDGEIDSTSSQESELILDFFAGSGTTAQAVMELNAEDNGNRSFILVQLDEAVSEVKSKSAYDFCKNTLHSTTPVISDITIERVKRAGEKISTENKDKILDLGFKVYSLCDKPQIITDRKGHLKLEEKSFLTPQDKATNLALQSGKTLDKDLMSIVKNKLYKCEDSYYVISCDEKVLEVLREAQNEYIFIDGYADITLQDFLNFQSFAKERLKVIY